MLSLLLVSTLSQIAADEWRPFTANPRYEVYGHMDGGVFRYSRYRLKTHAHAHAPAPAPAPARIEPQRRGDTEKAKDYATNGVILRREELIESSVRGNDAELARTLAQKDLEFRNRQDPSRAQSSPCPGPGPCPRPAPRPAPSPLLPGPVKAIERDVALIALVVLAVVIFGGMILCGSLALLFLGLRTLWRSLTGPAPA